MVPEEDLPKVYRLLGESKEDPESIKGNTRSSELQGRAIWRDPDLVRRHLLPRSATIRGLAKYLAARPDQVVDTGEAATALNLPAGWNSLAGALGAFGHYCVNRDLPFPWETRENTLDERVRFYLDGDTAKVIREVLGDFKA